MKVLIVLLTLLPSISLCQNVKVVKFDAVQKLLDGPPDKKIQVINFWATWCAPCVKELPYFEALQKGQLEKISITLISLDFADKVDKVNAFIKRKGITSPVLLLDEVDYNSWIDNVDKNWSGAIPATLFINPLNGKRKFIEKELEDGDLEKMLDDISK
jgi:thiol-disulfide isomerase/thioredoxin